MIGANPPGWAYPGQGYAGTTAAAQEYTDSATITVVLTPTTTDVDVTLDSSTVPVVVQASGVDTLGAFLDSATITVALAPSVAEVFEGADSYTSYVSVQPSGVDVQAQEAIDAATTYLDLQPLGGECFSTFTGLQLEAEAYARWSPGSQEDRWSETEDCRWLASEPEILYPLEGDGFARWHPGEDVVRWSSVDDCRWNIVGITAAGVIC